MIHNQPKHVIESLSLTEQRSTADRFTVAFHDTLIKVMLANQYAGLRKALGAIRDLETGEQLTANNLHLLVIEADSFHALKHEIRPTWHLDCPQRGLRDDSWIELATDLLDMPDASDAETLLCARTDHMPLTVQAIALIQWRETGTIDMRQAFKLANNPAYVRLIEGIANK